MPRRFNCLVWALAGSLLSALPLYANHNWPTFRGADRSAVSDDTDLLESWPEGGPQLAWKSTGAGRGYAELAIADGKIYTLGDAPSTASDGDEYLSCFSQKDGQPIWHTKTGVPWTEGKPDWQSSRGTPTVDGDRVYVITPFGDLLCCSTADGAVQWKKSLKDDFGGKKADGWGYSESPLVDGDALICTPGGEQTTMVALNKKTGETLWTVVRPEDRGAGHSSIVISQIKGAKVYVQMTGTGAMGVQASDGKLLWSYPIEKTTCIIPTPIVRDDLVYFAVGYKRGAALLRQVPGADGAVEIKEVYPLNIKLANKHGGVVLVGDYVYGDSDDAGIPYCADLMTGEVKWTKRGPGKGSTSVVAADGHLYFLAADGNIALVKADAADYVEVGKFQLPDSGERPSWAHPVIVDGKLYLRQQDHVFCYDLRAAGKSQVSR
ncbi:PQQ-like beta-propeller repeat protein [Planctomicrobium piriforme]|uniref:Outer membrane protein assembly factor BamB, contains PQQ-like beta-propeller repeat n=1 Tax=Planctomicrobium piriforme TaxID=1576369 RepID=A0A1I3NIG3_9PLAN|nr:PQQ-like beta-propeller repeat protein [Planctomicrobium piriforme]SFJ09093.1 Outer membrane protein assembly factor BamB, contains PQQ-like beta-propeller repeat [Planctomicrobium piriforme]